MSHSRLPVPPTRGLIRPGGRGHQAAMVATGAVYSAALSDCWNNGSSSQSSSQPSTSNSTRLAQADIKTSCLFCSKVVMLAGLHPEPAEVINRRQKNLQNLCIHFKLNRNEIPTNGTKIQFPFCVTCEKYVNELTKLQEILEKVKAEIDKRVNSIERIVADTEILGNRGQPSPIERQKFIKLYDMILEGYRNKLIVRHQISNSMIFEAAPIEPDNLSPNPIENGENHATGIEMEEEYDETIKVFTDSHDDGAEVRVDNDEELSNTTVLNSRGFYQDERYTNDRNTEYLGEVPNCDENNSILVPCTSVQSVAAVGSGTPNGDARDGASSIADIELIDFVEIDNEAMTPQDEEDDKFDRNVFSDDVNDDIEQQQLFIFDNGDAQSIHKRQLIGPHPKVGTLSCNICEKPVRGALIHLLRHKFTHKNDEERRESLRKKERGSYNAFLSKKLAIAYKSKQNIGVQNANCRSLTAKRASRIPTRNNLTLRGASAKVGNSSAPAAAGSSKTGASTSFSIRTRSRRYSENVSKDDVRVAVGEPFGCRVCNKHFGQKNHLTLHMRTHGLRRSERGQTEESENEASTSSEELE